MSRETWELIKSSKNFYVNSYRRGLITLILSLILNCIFGVLIAYIHLTEPERDFYATSGIAPPIQLQPLSAPNYSSNALLPPDPPAENEDKLIPQ
ncbi:Component of the Dot/Icm secretion system. inner membrane protein [Legionella steigerwaltii]|uniref:Component of the Dot/Icm secretion system. inner membrane protein n=1 Tax=Legionella steigerwaltii TaxID=460 RepID=A0A378LCW3_9GAMM|nr:type IVB secretion system protein IcmM/DotJ [Legionella steigerwaltii]KTD77245.1 IcmM (DotJ) [Legionella steigerwaltii]STY21971.1 Component of the Dot/Icm secretion system. inner membrane protein [Legionella steigerwaltii]